MDENVVYMYNRMLFSCEKKENPAILDNTDGPRGIMLSEISQPEKDKYCVVSLICGIVKKKKGKLVETESSKGVARGLSWRKQAEVDKRVQLSAVR